MKTEEVRAEVERIRSMVGDPEAAHGAERALWEKVLRHIAEEASFGPAWLAEAALETLEIDFPRWMA